MGVVEKEGRGGGDGKEGGMWVEGWRIFVMF